jgi:hypothetical protein
LPGGVSFEVPGRICETRCAPFCISADSTDLNCCVIRNYITDELPKQYWKLSMTANLWGNLS